MQVWRNSRTAIKTFGVAILGEEHPQSFYLLLCAHAADVFCYGPGPYILDPGFLTEHTPDPTTQEAALPELSSGFQLGLAYVKETLKLSIGCLSPSPPGCGVTGPLPMAQLSYELMALNTLPMWMDPEAFRHWCKPNILLPCTSAVTALPDCHRSTGLGMYQMVHTIPSQIPREHALSMVAHVEDRKFKVILTYIAKSSQQFALCSCGLNLIEEDRGSHSSAQSGWKCTVCLGQP
ncbi:hypothetical protein STEG23_029129 [Scotinomys teguina]